MKKINYLKEGIMVGVGELWINDVISTGSDSKLMIIAINN